MEITLLFFFSFFFFLFLSSVSASSTNDQPTRTVIVKVQHDAKPSIFPTHRHWYDSSLSSLSPPSSSSYSNPNSNSKPKAIHTYETVFQGFSAKLSPTEVLQLQSFPHVLAVIPERVRQLHTTRSPEFLGLKTPDSAGLLKESDFGSDLVIGVIDTGIWPEKGLSFSLSEDNTKNGHDGRSLRRRAFSQALLLFREQRQQLPQQLPTGAQLLGTELIYRELGGAEQPERGAG